jgi:hypothetical protein
VRCFCGSGRLLYTALSGYVQILCKNACLPRTDFCFCARITPHHHHHHTHTLTHARAHTHTHTHTHTTASRVFPELPAKGAWSSSERYTWQELRSVVAFGQARGVRVVPEFDMPGHATSWRESHPEIFSSGAPSTCGSPVDGRCVKLPLARKAIPEAEEYLTKKCWHRCAFFFLYALHLFAKNIYIIRVSFCSQHLHHSKMIFDSYILYFFYMYC